MRDCTKAKINTLTWTSRRSLAERLNHTCNVHVPSFSSLARRLDIFLSSSVWMQSDRTRSVDVKHRNKSVKRASVSFSLAATTSRKIKAVWFKWGTSGVNRKVQRRISSDVQCDATRLVVSLLSGLRVLKWGWSLILWAAGVGAEVSLSLISHHRDELAVY